MDQGFSDRYIRSFERPSLSLEVEAEAEFLVKRKLSLFRASETSPPSDLFR